MDKRRLTALKTKYDFNFQLFPIAPVDYKRKKAKE